MEFCRGGAIGGGPGPQVCQGFVNFLWTVEKPAETGKRGGFDISRQVVETRIGVNRLAFRVGDGAGLGAFFEDFGENPAAAVGVGIALLQVKEDEAAGYAIGVERGNGNALVPVYVELDNEEGKQAIGDADQEKHNRLYVFLTYEGLLFFGCLLAEEAAVRLLLVHNHVFFPLSLKT